RRRQGRRARCRCGALRPALRLRAGPGRAGGGDPGPALPARRGGGDGRPGGPAAPRRPGPRRARAVAVLTTARASAPFHGRVSLGPRGAGGCRAGHAGGDVTAAETERRQTTDPDVEPIPCLYRAIADPAVNPFAVVDDDGVFRWVGRSIEELLGWRPEELVGRTIDAIVAPHCLDEVLEAFAQLEHVPGKPRYPRGGVGQPADLICRDGSITHCSVVAATKSQTG